MKIRLKILDKHVYCYYYWYRFHWCKTRMNITELNKRINDLWTFRSTLLYLLENAWRRNSTFNKIICQVCRIAFPQTKVMTCLYKKKRYETREAPLYSVACRIYKTCEGFYLSSVSSHRRNNDRNIVKSFPFDDSATTFLYWVPFCIIYTAPSTNAIIVTQTVFMIVHE